MRGLHLAATGIEYTWTDLGRPLGWSASTCSDVSSGRRVLRVADIASLAYLLGASPGWLAFEEGVARPGHHEPIPGVPMDYGVEVTDESLETEAEDARVRRAARGKRRA